MATAVETARQEWDEGYRRLEESARDRVGYERLLAQMEAIVDELRRRVGQTFTLAQLADAYAEADRWSRDVVAERAASPGWPRTVSVAEAAAFYAYQRGATDYEP
jgi:hypothetical protein